VTRPTVNLWRNRYAERGLVGLDGVRPPGRPRRVDRAKVITVTLTPPPRSLGVTHWSSRVLAERLGIEHSTVAGIWKEYGVKPWKAETFKFTTDPELEAKVVDVVGLYLAPPQNAVVLCVDEKSHVQALNRTQKTLPMQPGHAEQRTHDYRRHGITNLFAALDVASGRVTADCYPERTGARFVAFLRKAVKPHAGKEIHVVLDNLSTHDTPEVRAWLAANPNVRFHFTPVGSSWLNMIEIWFGIITRQSIRRGTFTSVNALIVRIRDYVQHWNADAKPFTWTATTDEILAKVRWVQTSVRQLVDNNAK